MTVLKVTNSMSYSDVTGKMVNILYSVYNNMYNKYNIIFIVYYWNI